MKLLHALGGVLLSLSAATHAQEGQRASLLVIGAPHFANPGRDVANARVPDVLAPDRQREIEAIVERLAAYRPTRVAVEWPADEQARLDQRYADYRAGRRSLTANEIDQLGMRLASRLNLSRVDAVDWNGDPPGGWDPYNYPAWAEANGRGAAHRAWVERLQTRVDADARLMACTPVSSWLRRVNTRSYREADQRVYFEIAEVGDPGGVNPGAAWVGTWYTRNLRILNNLRRLAAGTEERILVIYGAGHGYLLDQQARESGAFEIVDSLEHLPSSPRDAWTRCPG